jgi:transaldolase
MILKRPSRMPRVSNDSNHVFLGYLLTSPGLISHVQQLLSIETSRICIKIPATWEGLQACRELEKKGITTLATIVFSLEQTALAAAAGCRYIAPYVNELRVHFDST